MVPRNAVLIAATGAAAVLWLVSFHASGSSPLPVPVVGSRAAAQDPAVTGIIVTTMPSIGDNADLWQRFEITVPANNPPLDMHTVFLVDGKGTKTISEQPKEWPQPIPFKYCLSLDDDFRVKAILRAQGLPIKENLVTYHFVAEAYGSIGYYRTIHFRHGFSGPEESIGPNEVIHAQVGQKIVLENRLITDSAYKGDLDKNFSFNQWTQPEFAPITSPGMVHHLVVYLLFTPHHGPAVKGHRSITQNI